MQKTKLTYDRHTELGDELHAMSESITRLVAELSNAMPKTSAACAAAKKTSSALLALRCELETVMFDMHPSHPKGTHVYFGQRVVKTAPFVA